MKFVTYVVLALWIILTLTSFSLILIQGFKFFLKNDALYVKKYFIIYGEGMILEKEVDTVLSLTFTEEIGCFPK